MTRINLILASENSLSCKLCETPCNNILHPETFCWLQTDLIRFNESRIWKTILIGFTPQKKWNNRDTVRGEGTFQSGFLSEEYSRTTSKDNRVWGGERGWARFPNPMYKLYITAGSKQSLPNVNKYLRTPLQDSSSGPSRQTRMSVELGLETVLTHQEETWCNQCSFVVSQLHRRVAVTNTNLQ